jgi:hypothetical protein
MRIPITYERCEGVGEKVKASKGEKYKNDDKREETNRNETVRAPKRAMDK